MKAEKSIATISPEEWARLSKEQKLEILRKENNKERQLIEEYGSLLIKAVRESTISQLGIMELERHIEKPQ